MYELNNVCSSLKNNSSRKVKEQILEDNKDFILFKEVLRFLYDKNITTGLDIKKINTEVMVPLPVPAFDNLIDLMEYLKRNNTGSSRDILVAQLSIKKIGKYNDEHKNLLKEIVTKSLKLGIDAKTVNKVYGEGFIPTFDVQLGTPIEKVNLSGNEKIYISQKLNGTRCVYYNGDLWTRSGKKYTGCQHIINDIKNLFNNWKCPEDAFVLDGELVLKKCGLSDSEAFQKGTGIANSDKETKEELEYVIFDIITKSQFETKNSVDEATYDLRRGSVLAIAQTGNETENIRIVPFLYKGYDHSMIYKCLDDAENNDWEGIMINLDTPYEFKRTKNLIKVKKFYDIDLECIEVINSEKGKYKNTLGAIVCKYGDNVIKVGSGFTDEQRDYYYNHQDEIIGKIVSVKYKEKTKNKDGSESLQFPVFLCVREDKYEADI